MGEGSGLSGTSHYDGEADDELRRRLPVDWPERVKAAEAAEKLASPAAMAADAAAGATFRVVNRAMIKAGQADEPVAGCTIAVGTGAEEVRGQTDAEGRATLNLSGLANGRHRLVAVAPNSSDEEPGPTFPSVEADRIFRPLTTTVDVKDGRIVGGIDESVGIANGVARVGLQPTWMRSGNTSSRSVPVDMIVIHHTADMSLRSVLRQFLYPSNKPSSAHYVVGVDGAVYKLVRESRVAWQAGHSAWRGRDGMNENSVGIEIVHTTGQAYPDAQAEAVVRLVESIRGGHPSISAERVVGHSDVAVNAPAERPPKRHGRKSTDPGSAFPWELLEVRGIGLVPGVGEPDANMYAGFFASQPTGKLKSGDAGDAVLELQRDLSKVGYHCPADGSFGAMTHWALQMFQQHMFSGSRRLDANQWNSGDGRLDRKTATMLKQVLGEVAPLVS
jgi:N-acetylmuramoyl-L-alanine amidase